MLMASCRTPQDLGFIRIELQSVGLHPGRDGVGALRHSQCERISSGWRTRAVNLRVISVEMGRETVAFDERDQVRGAEHE